MTADSTCALCGSESPTVRTGLVDRLYGVEGTWNHRHCARCDLWWLTPRPCAEDIPSLYADYYTHESGQRPIWGRYGSLKEAGARKALGYPAGRSRWPRAFLAGLVQPRPVRDLMGGFAGWIPGPPRGRLLDVGCGSGELLARLRSLGWDVEGTELDASAADAARGRFQLEIHQASLAEMETLGRFDLISLSHVLEHLPDPIDSLRVIRSCLNGDGMCVVSTPNAAGLGARRFGSDWVHWDPPRHLFLFSPRSASLCAERAGFRIRMLTTSARLARFTWTASTSIRESGTANLESKPPRSRRIAAAAFQLRQSSLRGLVGEELVMYLEPAARP